MQKQPQQHNTIYPGIFHIQQFSKKKKNSIHIFFYLNNHLLQFSNKIFHHEVKQITFSIEMINKVQSGS